tara:strand:+ start:1821 stop:2204 length:384 start_codon:yes stop_codon:yes gene_type:complete
MPSIQRTAVAANNAPTTSSAKSTADDHVQVVDVTVAADGRSGPYYPGPECRAIILAATGTCKFQMRGSGGSGGLADSNYRSLVMSAEAQTATATNCGILTQEIVPYEFYLFDTSGSSNPCTLHFIYA